MYEHASKLQVKHNTRLKFSFDVSEGDETALLLYNTYLPIHMNTRQHFN